jgi:pimeloyl-ACP methyl ester carboxylesterase
MLMRKLRVVRDRYVLAMRAPRNDREFESRWTNVGGIRLHDRASRNAVPAAFPVVLVHGLAVSHRYLMPLAAELAHRYPVRVVDLPGFGLMSLGEFWSCRSWPTGSRTG